MGALMTNAELRESGKLEGGRFKWDSDSAQWVKISGKVPNRGIYQVQEKTLRESILQGYRDAESRGPLRNGFKASTIKRVWGS